jgi:hypothetical protein
MAKLLKCESEFALSTHHSYAKVRLFRERPFRDGRQLPGDAVPHAHGVQLPSCDVLLLLSTYIAPLSFDDGCLFLRKNAAGVLQQGEFRTN